MKYKIILTSFFSLFLWVEVVSQCMDQRNHFNFLNGEWIVVSTKTPEESWQGGNDRYVFELKPDGLITSSWYFNRGTGSKPNYTYGNYFSGFDNMSCTWNFYYTSSNASMFYQGKQIDGDWWFFKTFNISGTEFDQRQLWKLQDDGKVLRLIENSYDKGKSWTRGYEILLEKIN